LLKQHVPLRTDRWDVTTPGFTEVDLVAHSGDRAEGEFAHTVNQTDIVTTWVESRAVLGKSQVRVQQALEAMRHGLPFRLLGIDSDNGSEFLNAHLVRYCKGLEVQFTRGRPYKKDDNAHIEQKNWTHVRKLVGYERYDTEAAVAALNAVYAELRLFQNLFLPTVKLVRKERVGARTRRRYDTPQTPWTGCACVPKPTPTRSRPWSRCGIGSIRLSCRRVLISSSTGSTPSRTTEPYPGATAGRGRCPTCGRQDRAHEVVGRPPTRGRPHRPPASTAPCSSVTGVTAR